MSEIAQQKKGRETYYIMRAALRTKKIEAKADTFPSDQFIFKNLPDAIKKTNGASKPVKTILAAVAITTVAVIGGIFAPLAMAAFGALSITSALLGSAAGLTVAGAGYLTASSKIKEIKKHIPNISKKIMAKHIVQKASDLKQNWKDNKVKNQEIKEKRKAEKPTNGVGKLGSILNGTLKVKDAWDKSVTDDSKKKLQDSFDSAKDTASDVAQGAKNKIGKMFRNFRGKKGPDNK